MSESCNFSNSFLLSLQSYHFLPTIDKPTRVHRNSATLIDNIYTNNLELSMHSGIFYTDLSDHLPVFQVTNFKLFIEPSHQKRLIRLINPATMSVFRSKLEDIDWSPVCSANSVNESYDTFSNLLTAAYRKSFPLIPAGSESRRPSKPWFSQGLFASCKRKNALYKQFRLNPTKLNK